ncbi:MAG: DJ-1/PfpI family protein [Clostridia bacterium]|nr:DJ-1/PfpI family protein [Clostridia bacterium]
MVYLFLADGFEEIEGLCVLDFLRRGGIETKTVGVSGKIANGSHKIPVTCDITVDDLDTDSDFDMIILPGGLPGSTNLDSCEAVDKMIKRAVNEDKFICAICAAPFILGKRGILKGKRATCYPGFEKELVGAEIVDCGVVRDGKIITGRAMGSSHDFALEIVEALCGKEMREKLKSAVLY